MSSTIIRATQADIDTLMPFVLAFHELEKICLADRKREEAVRGLLGNDERGGIWLIVEGGIPVGYIALCKGYSIEFCGYDGFIDEFFIRPESRGRGLGASALASAKKAAKEMGIRALHLEVSLSNRKARNFYSAANFAERDGYALMTVVLDD